MAVTVTRLKERYQLESELSRGEGGVVYRAIDRVLGDKPVVLKAMVADGAADGQATQQRGLHDAANQIATLAHPNLVSLSDWFIESGRLYLVSGFVEGETLASVMGSREISMQEAAGWVDQVAAALEGLHGLNPLVICGVVDPSHVMIDGEGRSRLVNLGVARCIDVVPSVNKPRRNLTEYAAPEAEGNAGIDKRADIYSLGAVMYHLFTGNRPPKGLDLALRRAMLPRPSEAHAAIPKSLEGVILKAMAVEQGSRYRSMRDLRADLQRVPKAELRGATGGTAGKANGPRSAGAAQPELRMPAPPKPVSSRGQGAFVDAVVQEEFDHQRSQRRKGAGKRLAVVVVVVGLFASLMGGAWYAGAYFRSAPGAAVAASEPAAQVGSVSSDGKPVAGSRRSSTHLAPADQTSFNCTIDSEPRGAEVLVDGQPASGVDSKFTPMNIWLEPDKKHTIQIKKDGYEVSSLSKRVESGKVGNINARLTQTLAQAQSGKPKAGKPPVSLPSGGVPSVRGTEPQVQSPVEASPPQPSAPVAAPSASPLGTTTPKPTAQSESPKAPNRDDTEAGKPMPTATAGQDSLPGASDIKWPENLGKSKIPGL